MAYPTVSAPYGLKPVNLIGGQVFAGGTRLMQIASGYATNIFYGDLVKRVADGTIELDNGTSTATPTGIFLGVSFTNSNGQVQQQQFYPASQSIKSGSQIFAVVADDPDTLFQVVSCNATTVVTAMGITAIGSNVALIQNAGSTTTGNSKVAINTTTLATTPALPIRIIDVVRETATGADAFVEFIVKININTHQYTTPTGVA